MEATKSPIQKKTAKVCSLLSRGIERGENSTPKTFIFTNRQLIVRPLLPGTDLVWETTDNRKKLKAINVVLSKGVKSEAFVLPGCAQIL